MSDNDYNNKSDVRKIHFAEPDENADSGYACDACEKTIKKTEYRYHCCLCGNYDLCYRCYMNIVKPREKDCGTARNIMMSGCTHKPTDFYKF